MKKKPKKRIIWFSLIIAVFIIALTFLFSGEEAEQNGRKTVSVDRVTIIDKALAVGSIEPINEIDVKSKVSGVVGKLFVSVGDRVSAGDPLVEIKPDPTPLELAQATRDIEMASIEVQTLEKDLKRKRQLKSEGFISDHELEILVKQYEEAKLRQQIAQEKLDLIKQGKVTIAETNIETVVKAPLSGFILEKTVNLGDPVVPLTSYQPGTPIMRMADMSDLIFKGTVDEIDVGKISEGMFTEIQIGALPGKSVEGNVSLISLKAKKEDRTTVFPVEIVITNKADVRLRAGYSANANIIIARRDSVLAIPERVVTFRNDSAFVNIPLTEETSQERYIKTGLSDAIMIEVKEGLKLGDEVLEKEVREII